ERPQEQEHGRRGHDRRQHDLEPERPLEGQREEERRGGAEERVLGIRGEGLSRRVVRVPFRQPLRVVDQAGHEGSGRAVEAREVALDERPALEQRAAVEPHERGGQQHDQDGDGTRAWHRGLRSAAYDQGRAGKWQGGRTAGWYKQDVPERIPAIKVILLPKDTNPGGSIFGGVILSHVDLASAVEARKAGR